MIIWFAEFFRVQEQHAREGAVYCDAVRSVPVLGVMSGKAWFSESAQSHAYMNDTDFDALELLRSDICKLFPPGPVRERWLAWVRSLFAPNAEARVEPGERIVIH